MALLLNDAHPTYSSLFRYHGDGDQKASDEETQYMSLVYGIQQRRLGLFSPNRGNNHDETNDPDWLWLLQFACDIGSGSGASATEGASLSVSASGSRSCDDEQSSVKSIPGTFSQDLSASLRLGRSSFEQLYLSSPEIDFDKEIAVTSDDSKKKFEVVMSSRPEVVERHHGESSLLFLRRLRRRGLSLHALLNALRHNLTSSLSHLQDFKSRDVSPSFFSLSFSITLLTN